MQLNPWLPKVIRKHITVSGECWNWDSLDYGGYGRVTSAGHSQIAHRAVWQILRGEVPEGLQLDHLCRNRRCVNPDHLEPVTGVVNLRRSPITVNSINLAKTECPSGHPYSGSNLLIRTNRKGQFRTCLECKRAQDAVNQRRYRLSRKAA